ncbi:MAG TPA: hypothetical protein PKY96_08880 [Flavobacteriales bacterium]|nr:hypothetical protein [Flavobacteriales bacterium]
MLRFCSLLALVFATAVQAQVPIGSWREHLPWQRMVDVVEGDGGVYCATANAVFHYNKGTNETRRLSKVNLLNDVEIRGLAWCEELGMLLVHYGNGNLDLVQGNRSFNMGDIRRSALLGDKAIYRILVDGTTAYLSCGFGIVVVDLQRREVKETWLIGPDGGQVRVRQIALHNDSIYAATTSGLFVAWRNASNLAAFTNWRRRSDMGGLMANGPFNQAVSYQGRLFVNYDKPNSNNDTLLILRADNTWEQFGPGRGTFNVETRVSENGQFLLFARDYDLVQYNAALEVENSTFSYGAGGQFCTPARMIQALDGTVWIADRDQGLVRLTGFNQGVPIRPNGPTTANAYRMAAGGGRVYVATGSVTGNWGNAFLKDGVHHFGDETWRTTNRSNSTIFETGGNEFGQSLNDPVAVAIDPLDPSRAYVGSWEDGIVEFRDREPVVLYNNNNSSLGLATNDGGGKVNVAGLDFDEQGNLWASNAHAAAPISVRARNGQWYSYSPGAILGGNALLGEIIAASNGYKWLIRPRATGLLVFNDNGTLADSGDDQYKLITTAEGSGGLPSIDVLSIAEDLEGQIWVGTNKGVAVFYNPSDLFSSAPSDAQQILIEQDGNVQILLETEFISAIAVDGANRKWIGTQTGGVFLISADGRAQIARFTAANSPLLSNTINAIAIEGSSGEVFIATDRGIVSFRSDAIDPSESASCAKVFPNPVREGYTGPVAVTGLARDSEVRITDASGNLVYKTTSLGGQAIWNASDMNGNRVATGVYLIFASDPDGVFKCNTKVLVAR